VEGRWISRGGRNTGNAAHRETKMEQILAAGPMKVVQKKGGERWASRLSTSVKQISRENAHLRYNQREGMEGG